MEGDRSFLCSQYIHKQSRIVWFLRSLTTNDFARTTPLNFPVTAIIYSVLLTYDMWCIAQHCFCFFGVVLFFRIPVLAFFPAQDFLTICLVQVLFVASSVLSCWSSFVLCIINFFIYYCDNRQITDNTQYLRWLSIWFRIISAAIHLHLSWMACTSPKS